MGTFATLLAPGLGVVLANAMWVSPVKEVLAARERGDLGPLNPFPWLLIYNNCPVSISYSILRHDYFIFFANIVGAPLGLFFLLTAAELSTGEVRRKLERGALAFYMGSVILALVVRCVLKRNLLGVRSPQACVCSFCAPLEAQVGLALNGQHDRQTAVVGTVSTCLAGVFYASPLSTLAQVVRSRDASSLSVPLCATSLTCALAWCIYGAARRDAPVFIANVPGVLCGAAQVALIMLFGSRSRGAASAGGGTGGVGMQRLGSRGAGGGKDTADEEEAGLLPLRAFDEAPAGPSSSTG